MKEILYDNATIKLLQVLKNTPPKRIFSDEFYRVVFDYGDFHVEAAPQDAPAASQNESDEAIFVTFVRVDSVFQPGENDKLLFQNESIRSVWVLRTLLYFTDHVVYESEEEALGDFIVDSKIGESIANLLRRTSGGHEEIVCHPEGEEAETVKPEFATLVDAGALFEIGDKPLLCLAQNNGYQVVGRTIPLEQVAEDIAPYYKIIEI